MATFLGHKWLVAIPAILIVVFVIVAVASDLDKGNGSTQDTDKPDEWVEDKDNIKQDKGEATLPFTAAQLEHAELALSQGIHIEDPTDDFFQVPPGSVQPDGRPDNPDPYPLPYTDVRSLSVGADEQYLYIKYQFWGEFPLEGDVYNGDAITAVGAKLTDFTFTNENGPDSAEIGLSVTYFFFDPMENAPAVPIEPMIGQGAMISPTGTDEYQETIYKEMTGAGMVGGGPGYDYLISALPLSLFGLSYGDEIVFGAASETGSSIYHHEVIDILLSDPAEKFGDLIRYRLGASTYEVIEFQDKGWMPDDGGDNLPPDETPSLITPYVDIADMATINEAYSTSENAPWSFAHQGVDFFPVGNLAPFRAVCSGTIGEFRLWQASENSNWQVNVSIEYNETYTVGYAFEPFSTDPAVGQAQLDNMLVSAGQQVKQGDIIGYLVFGGGGTHVDFNLSKDRDRVSPENYFTPEALASVLEILHRTFPGASLSYP